MDLSQLKWLKNVKHQKSDKLWAYNEPEEMQIPEAKIFCLHWRGSSDQADAQKPLKGDLIALVQRAKVSHIVEVLDNGVYKNAEAEKEWGIYYRVVKAVWMPPEGLDWYGLPRQEVAFGVKDLPPDGHIHEIPTDGMRESQLWKNLGGLEDFQKRLSERLTQISLSGAKSISTV